MTQIKMTTVPFTKKCLTSWQHIPVNLLKACMNCSDTVSLCFVCQCIFCLFNYPVFNVNCVPWLYHHCELLGTLNLFLSSSHGSTVCCLKHWFKHSGSRTWTHLYPGKSSTPMEFICCQLNQSIIQRGKEAGKVGCVAGSDSAPLNFL